MKSAPATNSIVRLTAERTKPGTILLTLHNDSANTVGYNLCTSALQRRSGSEWTAVPTGEMCTMQILDLPPGGKATFEKSLPSGLGRGEYRYVTSVEKQPEAAQVVIASDAFTVE